MSALVHISNVKTPFLCEHEGCPVFSSAVIQCKACGTFCCELHWGLDGDEERCGACTTEGRFPEHDFELDAIREVPRAQR